MKKIIICSLLLSATACLAAPNSNTWGQWSDTNSQLSKNLHDCVVIHFIDDDGNYKNSSEGIITRSVTNCDTENLEFS